MPLTVAVMAELNARDLESGVSASRKIRIPVDRQTLDEVLAKLEVRLTLAVPDVLSGADDPILVELTIDRMKAFRPGAVAEQIPATRELVRIREALLELKVGRMKLDDFRTLLDSCTHCGLVVDRIRAAFDTGSGGDDSPAPPSSTDEGSGGGLDDLLDRVGAPSAGEGSGAGDLARLQGLIRDVVRAGGSAAQIPSSAVDGAVEILDAALSRQIDEVLHHPEFRRLEAAWRGLKFLLDRVEPDKGIRIEVVPCGGDDLLPAYDEAVHLPESQGMSEHPVGFVLVDRSFGRNPEDMDLLRGLSERGASLSVPMIASAGSEILGLESAADLASMESLRDTFAGPEYDKWRGLRDTGPTRWLNLAFNAFLLRPAYEPGDAGAKAFRYTESFGGSADRHRLWGNAGWAIAGLAVRSFARIGWCTDIMGQRAAGTVEDLPVRPFKGHRTEPAAYPLECSVTDKLERDLCDNGIMTLVAAVNGDKAFLRFAPSVHAPHSYHDPMDKARAKLQSTLPFQMFVGRVVNYALLIEPMIVPGQGPEAIQAAYTHAIRELLASAGPVPQDAVEIGVPPNEDDPSIHDLVLKVRWPGFQSLKGAGDLELRWPLSG
jgi:type VI secretion system protein ImpC